jgi:hypothetical protein
MMKSKGQQSGRVTIRGLAFIFACTALPWLLFAGPIPTSKPAHYPAWWFERDVVMRTDTNVSNPAWPTHYPPVDDYTAVNQGQLKHIAQQAHAELNARLPGGAGTNLTALINNFTTNNNYDVVNIGQVKNVAEAFYNRLIEVQYVTNSSMPWAGLTPVDDYAVANAGQVKKLFSFDLTAPENELPEWWQRYYFGETGISPTADADNDGLTNLVEYEQGSDPTNYYDQGGSLIVPVLEKISGDQQSALTSQFLPLPLVVHVGDGSITHYPNAPVTFSIPSGQGMLALTNVGSPQTYSSLNRSADASGLAQVYVQAPATAGEASTVTVTTGGVNTTYTFTTLPATGIKVWLKADAGVIKDGGDFISQWDDQSGNNNHAAQTTADKQPRFFASIVNGKPVVRFDGSNDFLTTAINAMGGTEMTWIVVAKGSSYQSLIRAQSSGYLVYPWNNQFINSADGGTTGGITARMIANQWNIGVASYKTSGAMSTWCNGSLVYDRNANSADLPNEPLKFGSNAGTSEFSNADVAEIILYSRELTALERLRIEAYLSAKYAIYTTPAPAPTLSPNGSIFASSQSVTMSSPIAGAEIRYTTNGSDPISTSTLYSGSFSITDTTTVKAKVFAPGYAASPTATRTFIKKSGTMPQDVSGLQMWLRADLGVTQDENNRVSSWMDQSGNGFNVTQAVAPNMPVWMDNTETTVPVTWTSLRNMSLNSVTNELAKSAGGNAWNADAVSTQTLTGDGAVTFESTAGVDVYCGLNYTNSNAADTDLDYAVYLWSGGLAQVRENGTDRAIYVSYTVGDKFTVRRTGSTVTYAKNGVVYYTSAVSSSGTLFVDCSIFYPNQKLINAQISGAGISGGAARFAGSPSVRFSGNQLLSAVSQVTIPDAMTAFVVQSNFNPTITTTPQNLLHLGGTSSGKVRGLRFRDSRQEFVTSSNNLTGGAVPNANVATLEMVELGSDKKAVKFYRNGQLLAANNLPSTAGALDPGIRLGQHGDGGGPLTGDLSEIIVFNRALSSTERAQMEDYLFQRYGMAYPAPQVTPANSVFTGSVEVGVNWPYSGWQVRYTTNGSEPTESSSLYTAPLTFTATTVLKVRAFKGGVGSAIATADFELDAASSVIPRESVKLWLRSTVGVEKNGAGKVEAWNDLSGSAVRVAQPDDSKRPTFNGTLGSAGDPPRLTMTGTHCLFNNISHLALNGAMTVVGVYRTTAVADQQYLFYMGSGNGLGRGYGLYSSKQIFDAYNNYSQGATSVTGVHVEAASLNSARNLVKYYRDGVYLQSGPTSSTLGDLASALVVGAAYNHTSGLKGDLYELLVFEGELSEVQVSQITGALYSRYEATQPTALPPTVTPPGGLFVDMAELQVSTPYAEGVVRYTLDGSDPTGSSPIYNNAEPVVFTDSGSLRLRTYAPGYLPSAVIEPRYQKSGVPGTNLALWYRSDSQVETDGSGKVVTWRDISGQSRHAFQGLPANRPSLVANAYGTKPAVRFNGTDQWMLAQQALGDFSEGTLFVVIHPNSTTDTRCLISDADTAAGKDWGLFANTQGIRTIATKGTANLDSGFSFDGTVGSSPVVMAWRMEAASSQVFSNGKLVGTVSNSGSNVGNHGIQPGVGVFFDGANRSYYYNGDILELMVFSAALSDGQIAVLQAEAGARYGLSTNIVQSVVIEPADSSFIDSATVTLHTETPNAVIHYTTDGSEPTEASAIYRGPFVLDESTLVRTRAYSTGLEASVESQREFVRNAALAFYDSRSIRARRFISFFNGGNIQNGMDAARAGLNEYGGLSAISWNNSFLSSDSIYADVRTTISPDNASNIYGTGAPDSGGPTVPRLYANCYSHNNAPGGYAYATDYQKRLKVRGAAGQPFTIGYRVLKQAIDPYTGYNLTGDTSIQTGWQYAHFTGAGPNTDSNTEELSRLNGGSAYYHEQRWYVNDNVVWPGHVVVGAQTHSVTNAVTFTGISYSEMGDVKVSAREATSVPTGLGQNYAEQAALELAKSAVERLGNIQIDAQHRTRVAYMYDSMGASSSMAILNETKGLARQIWGSVTAMNFLPSYAEITPLNSPWIQNGVDYSIYSEEGNGTGSQGFRFAVNSQPRFRMKLPQGTKVWLNYNIRQWNISDMWASPLTDPPSYSGSGTVVKKLVIGPFVGKGTSTWTDWVDGVLVGPDSLGVDGNPDVIRRMDNFEVKIGYDFQTEDIDSSMIKGALMTHRERNRLDQTDADGNGIPLWRELELATGYSNPEAFYIGLTVTLTKVSGDDQSGFPNLFLPAPMAVRVLDENDDPVVGAPVVFDISNGGGTLLAVGDDSVRYYPNMVALTGTDGIARARYLAPGAAGTAQIQASAGTESETFDQTIALPPGVTEDDSDGDGVNDVNDDFPFDPTRSEGDPGDTNPPVITILKPEDAEEVP